MNLKKIKYDKIKDRIFSSKYWTTGNTLNDIFSNIMKTAAKHLKKLKLRGKMQHTIGQFMTIFKFLPKWPILANF